MKEEKRESWPVIKWADKCTPGPWDIGNEGDRHYFVAQNIPGKKFEIVARMPDGIGGKYINNAPLISQAPTMYRMIKGTVEWLDREIKDIIDCSPSKGTPARAERLEELRDDIAETLRKIEEV